MKMVQVTSEAKASPIITALTMMSADMNIDHGDNSRSATVVDFNGVGPLARQPPLRSGRQATTQKEKPRRAAMPAKQELSAAPQCQMVPAPPGAAERPRQTPRLPSSNAVSNLRIVLNIPGLVPRLVIR